MSPRRPSFGAVFENLFSSDLPWPERIRVAVKNQVTKVQRRSNCCGNHGDPGC